MPVSPKHGRQTPDDHEVDHVEPNVAFLAGQYNHKIGVHILTQAPLPGAGRKIGSIEMYSHDRFFMLSTDHLKEIPITIAHRQEAVAAFIYNLRHQ